MSNELLKVNIQKKLKELGYYNGNADGKET